jgi:hypothetical protein
MRAAARSTGGPSEEDLERLADLHAALRSMVSRP